VIKNEELIKFTYLRKLLKLSIDVASCICIFKIGKYRKNQNLCIFVNNKALESVQISHICYPTFSSVLLLFDYQFDNTSMGLTGFDSG